MDNQTSHKDPYALYRHLIFPYLSDYLSDYFHRHSIKKQAITEEASLNWKTLNKLLEGKDMNFNCYLRLLATMRPYCKNDEEFLDFILEFMKRALTEIWITWQEEPDGWMQETWIKMQKDKEKHETGIE